MPVQLARNWLCIHLPPGEKFVKLAHRSQICFWRSCFCLRNPIIYREQYALFAHKNEIYILYWERANAELNGTMHHECNASSGAPMQQFCHSHTSCQSDLNTNDINKIHHIAVVDAAELSSNLACNEHEWTNLMIDSVRATLVAFRAMVSYWQNKRQFIGRGKRVTKGFT